MTSQSGTPDTFLIEFIRDNPEHDLVKKWTAEYINYIEQKSPYSQEIDSVVYMSGGITVSCIEEATVLAKNGGIIIFAINKYLYFKSMEAFDCYCNSVLFRESYAHIKQYYLIPVSQKYNCIIIFDKVPESSYDKLLQYTSDALGISEDVIKIVQTSNSSFYMILKDIVGTYAENLKYIDSIRDYIGEKDVHLGLKVRTPQTVTHGNTNEYVKIDLSNKVWDPRSGKVEYITPAFITINPENTTRIMNAEVSHIEKKNDKSEVMVKWLNQNDPDGKHCKAFSNAYKNTNPMYYNSDLFVAAICSRGYYKKRVCNKWTWFKHP